MERSCALIKPSYLDIYCMHESTYCSSSQPVIRSVVQLVIFHKHGAGGRGSRQVPAGNLVSAPGNPGYAILGARIRKRPSDGLSGLGGQHR